MSDLLRIGEVAAAAGVSPRTVDYYTGLGLLSPVERTAGNFRLYPPDVVDRITAIRRLENQGVPLDEIAQALNATHPADLNGLLAQLDRDLHALREAATTVGPDAHRLLTVAAARAQSLLTTALELVLGLTPG